jgi:hypothetical protein
LVAAQDGASPEVPAERPVVDATRLIGAAVHVDGRLDEPAWEGAEFVSGFIQKDPVEGAPATLDTEIAFLYDEGSLYIGARMAAPSRESIRAQVTRRDNAGNAERLIVSIDSYNDKRTAYTFGVTASGVRVDYYHASDNERDRDYSWNPVWTASATTRDDGWTAEMRIPFSQLRFNAADVQSWGVNVNRFIPGRNEDTYWVYIPKQETGWSSRFGELRGISGIAPTRRVEVLPYVTSNATVNADRDPANPFDDGRNVEWSAGGDFKMGLGPGLTLDATVNPDFGQVDADPAVVNLSAFEVFFPERRPFFTEGAQLLQSRGAGYYYSRRIGGPPPGSARGAFVDPPAASTILAAAKISGRLASGLSVGSLAALTQREFARAVDDDGVQSRQAVAPLTAYAVGRVQQEFGADASTVGVMLTGVRRQFDGLVPGARSGYRGAPMSSFLNEGAFAGGMDWNLRFGGGTYEFRGSLGGSYISGSQDAILRQQRSSRRFYQRPDQDYVRVDSTRTSLTGYQASLSFDKRAGRHWLYSIQASAESPGFEINDAGRLGQADDFGTFGRLRYRETTPGSLFRNYNVSLTAFSGWNFGWVRQFSEVGIEANAELNNFWRTFLDLEVSPSNQSDNLTRGGPLMTRPASWSLGLGLSGNRAAQTGWDVFGFYRRDDLGGWNGSISAELEMRPSPRFAFGIEPRYSRLVNKRQYVRTAVGNRPEVYGGRYVFGEISRSEISAEMRLNYSFTPDLSLEIYAEPFVSSGQYVDFGELATAQTLFPVLRPELQRAVVPQQRGAALGVAPRQHAVPGVAAEQGRLG